MERRARHHARAHGEGHEPRQGRGDDPRGGRVSGRRSSGSARSLGDRAQRRIALGDPSPSRRTTRATNPLAGVDEDGINIEMHMMRSDRHGAGFVATALPLAYLSNHAVARLHQRESATSEGNFRNTLGLVAALAFMARLSAKHVGGQLCIALDESLIVGSIKCALQHCSDGSSRIGSILDVRTVLAARRPPRERCPAAGHDRSRGDRVRSGAHLVRSGARRATRTLADGIPALARRERLHASSQPPRTR